MITWFQITPDTENSEANFFYQLRGLYSEFQTVFNHIGIFNVSVVDIRLGEDETKLKAEITDKLADFVDNVDHSSWENVETEARNKDDVLNNAIVELIGNNANVIDTTIDLELNENETQSDTEFDEYLVNHIYGVNDSVVDIRLGEDETKLKAEINDNFPDFVDNFDHSSGENVETEARNKNDVRNNATDELISNNAIVIDTKVDMELNEIET